jgi:hypothetical protein
MAVDDTLLSTDMMYKGIIWWSDDNLSCLWAFPKSSQAIHASVTLARANQGLVDTSARLPCRSHPWYTPFATLHSIIRLG